MTKEMMPTLGELYRRLESMEATMNRRFDTQDQRLAQGYVPLDLYNSQHSDLAADLSEMKARAEADLGYRRALFVGVLIALLNGVPGLVALVLAVH